MINEKKVMVSAIDPKKIPVRGRGPWAGFWRDRSNDKDDRDDDSDEGGMDAGGDMGGDGGGGDGGGGGESYSPADYLIKSRLSEGSVSDYPEYVKARDAARADRLKSRTGATTQLGLKGISKDSPVNYPDLGPEEKVIRSIEDWHSELSRTPDTKPLPFFDAFMKDRGHELDTTHSHHELAGYDKVWEHPEIAAHNKDMMSKERKYGKVGQGGHILNTHFATLYKRRDLAGDSTVGRPKYVYVQGRIGNTWQKGIH